MDAANTVYNTINDFCRQLKKQKKGMKQELEEKRVLIGRLTAECDSTANKLKDLDYECKKVEESLKAAALARSQIASLLGQTQASDASSTREGVTGSPTCRAPSAGDDRINSQTSRPSPPTLITTTPVLSTTKGASVKKRKFDDLYVKEETTQDTGKPTKLTEAKGA
ncbi:hypothetical protein DACRYDRAFT_106241 [Dacryopinax primogenitus]|uniref:Uncharacterized protein n=1 Tax=Dacryopinax primogenitus (strain DJM 731) TaxID=1858805 RepID=M5GE82_DACPD|nr:uncharacterized protein DACRYDRAFT_106241 [Dacryopinax primogenitus]EJU03063.1 hypothetical protein DACRYDRAFT_106241 [Dacryopinax primogenitus]